MGRSFRAGWAPNGMLALPSGGVTQIPVAYFDQAKRPQDLPLGSLNLQTVQATPRHTAKLVADGQLVDVELERELVVRMLQTMREYSDLEPDKTDSQSIPKFVLTQENASKLLEAYVSLTEDLLQAEIADDDEELARLRLEHHAKVWCLVYALWGVISDQDPAYLLVENETAHSKNLERRLALDHWLQVAVRPFVDRDLEALDDEAQREGVSNDLQRIFILLTGKRIEEAVNLAIQLRDFRLATLIAQAHSSVRFASQSWPGDLDDQLHLWNEKQMSQAGTFDQTRLKIYRLLAGRVKEVAEDLEWFRVLALFAWYGSALDADLTSVIANYATAFPASTPDRIARPTPYYQLHKETTTAARGPTSPPYDMCFELLRQYYSRRLLEISNLLNPLNSSPFPLDFQLSWHLLTLLVALKPLDIPSPTLTANLTESYCAQLESLDLWEWAIFVLLHSGLEPAARERRVKELLGRNIRARGPVPNEQLLQDVLAQSGWGRDRPREIELTFTCDGPEGRVLETARVTLREGGLAYQVMHSLDDPRMVRGKFHSLTGWLRAMQPGLANEWHEDSRYLLVRLSTEKEPQSYSDFIASHPTNSDPHAVEEAIAGTPHLKGFGVPREWIEEALGYASLRMTSTQLDSAPSVRAVLWLEQPLQHFLRGGAWAVAYDLLVNRDLACALLLSERLPDLHYYFSCLAPHEALLPGWPSGGKLFHDYAAVRLAVDTFTASPDELGLLLEKLSGLSQTLEAWGADPVRTIANCAKCGETLAGLTIFTGTHPNSPQLHSACAFCVDCGRPSVQYASGTRYFCSECARRAEKQARAKGAKAVEGLHLQPLDLRYKPQPRLSNIALSELAYWVSSLPKVLQSAIDVETSISRPPQLLIPPSFRQFELDNLLSDYLTQHAL